MNTLVSIPKVYNKRDRGIPSGAVYIGRPSPWGNPFHIGKDGTRAEVVEKFRQYLNKKPELVQKAKRELAGKSLICWCAPLACHGDVWMEVI